MYVIKHIIAIFILYFFLLSLSVLGILYARGFAFHSLCALYSKVEILTQYRKLPTPGP